MYSQLLSGIETMIEYGPIDLNMPHILPAG